MKFRVSIASALLLCSASEAALAQAGGWTSYMNGRFNFRMAYPADVFQPAALSSAGATTRQDSGPDAEFDDTTASAPQNGDANGEDGSKQAYVPDNSIRERGQGPEPMDTGMDKENDGMTFVSRDGRAKIVTFATYNTENYSPLEYRDIILKEFKGYDRITYGPKRKTWFVLSGYRGNDIYYQKVMFSCGGTVINALSITFPREEKPFYEGIVERMEDNFRPARGPDCPKAGRRP
jgi:hypothetical protein